MSDGCPSEEKNNFIVSFFKKVREKKDEDGTELKYLVNEGHEQGVIDENEIEMINNIFEFGEKNADDIMTHRKNIVSLDSEYTVQQAFDYIIDKSYSRFPVINNDIDNIVGIMHIRDLLKVYADEENRNRTLMSLKNEIMFGAYCIPETRSISHLFKEMQSKKVHIAIVVDEYGQTAGIVTLEDILEEIVGNIQDEYDDEKELISIQDDGTYIIDGQTELKDIEDTFNIKFDCEDIDTINGYIIYKMGKIPEENDRFETVCGNYKFCVKSVENKMIKKISAEKIQ